MRSRAAFAAASATFLSTLTALAQPAPDAPAPQPEVEADSATQPAAAPDAAPAESTPAEPGTSTSGVATAAPNAEPDTARRFSDILGRPGGLTSAQAAKRAAETSLDAKAKQHQVTAASKNVTQVIYRAAPRLTLTARYTRLSPVDPPSFGSSEGSLVGTTEPPGLIPPGTPLLALDSSGMTFPIPENNFYLNAGLVVPVSDYILATGASIDAAESIERAAELNEQAARVTAGANARIAYYSWVQRELETIVAQQSLDQARAQLQTIENNYQAGRVAQADVLTAQAFVSQSELLVRRSRTNAAMAEHQLRLMLHDPPGKKYEIGENPLEDYPRLDDKRDLEQLYQEAARNRVEMKALDEQSRSLQRTSDVQWADTMPRVEIFGNVTYANPNQRIFPLVEEWKGTWDVGIQAVWSINDWGSTTAQKEQTLAQKQEVLAQRSAFHDAIKVEVHSAYRNLKDAELGLQTAQTGVTAAEAAHESRTLLLQHGRATSLELMNTETALLRARLELINAHVQLRMARVQLDHALGRDVN